MAVRYREDPRQFRLFDIFADIFSPTAYQKLRKGWQHLFRSAILSRMPAECWRRRNPDSRVGRPPALPGFFEPISDKNEDELSR